MSRITVFTDRYPYLGRLMWLLTVHYFIVQYIAAKAWRSPSYSWRYNTISDLGNTHCGITSGRFVCSPLHTLMNTSFIALGVLMLSGSLLIYQEFKQSLASLAGFSLLAIAGFGTVLVGLFPENTVPVLHVFGASLPFIAGNISLIILSRALQRLPAAFKTYTLLSGIIPLIALLLFVGHHYLGLGIGGMERVIAYPQTVWLIMFGVYTSARRYRRSGSIPHASTGHI